jgi:Protein of unknown function (DUF3375)/Uncharacterized protein conserved in bacteria C-term(DUF2220)
MAILDHVVCSALSYASTQMSIPAAPRPVNFVNSTTRRAHKYTERVPICRSELCSARDATSNCFESEREIMEYRTLLTLRQKHPAWRLLVADHAPLIASFFYDTFIRPNIRTMPQVEIISRLEDYLHSLRREAGQDAFPRPAGHYLDVWASDEHAWLRKYYPSDNDEPHFDITPATEKAIDWLVSLEQRRFVGTESRLMTIIELLRQLAEGTETDPWARIGELERRKSDIEAEIRRIREGHLYVLDATRIKERFIQIASTARELLSDFREVEQNFRELDRAVRERIATWDGGKAVLPEEIFGERDTITDSDQGKSFRAFWDFLMSLTRQEELSSLLAKVFNLQPVQELEPDRRMLRVHYDWLQAGEVAQRTVARLSEQLRRYLDDKAWLDNRRIMQLLREIEHSALAVRDAPPDRMLVGLDEPRPNIDLTMDRPLFSPPLTPEINELPSEGVLAHRALWVREEVPFRGQLSMLESDERDLYQALVENMYGERVRLEQERVSYSRVQEALHNIAIVA